ncbi:MAG: UDP-N-acetylmuramyl pentapeptide phosphotransferase [Desulfuromonas sp.]|nr:hypothetical protein [Desulfuromonas thiophila]
MDSVSCCAICPALGGVVLLLLVLLAGLLCWLGCRLLWWLAPQLGWLDVPVARSSHRWPTAKGAGLALLLALLLCQALLQLLLPGLRLDAPLLLALLAMAGLGFLADRTRLAAGWRLLGHLLVAAALLWGESLSPVSGLALLLFVAGSSNCYNFMDGINGLAGLTGLTAFAALLLYGLTIAGVPPAAPELVLAAVLVAACGAFLPWNLPQARLFLGDVGSLLLGFAFAALVVRLADGWASFLLLAGFLLPFYADEASSMVLRLRRGQSLLRPHRSHLYQLLANEVGWSHGRVSLLYVLVQLLLISLLLWQRHHPLVLLLLWLVTFAVFGALSAWLQRRLPFVGNENS